LNSAGVFERLTTSDESSQVPHFRVPGNTADFFIRKRLDQSPERIALAMRVRVQENRNAGAHRGESALERAGLAAIRLAQQPHPRLRVRERFHFGRGPVR